MRVLQGERAGKDWGGGGSPVGSKHLTELLNLAGLAFEDSSVGNNLIDHGIVHHALGTAGKAQRGVTLLLDGDTSSHFSPDIACKVVSLFTDLLSVCLERQTSRAERCAAQSAVRNEFLHHAENKPSGR